jgi:predicted transcriptional regulator
VENRISGLEDKIDIREKTEELLDKRHKSCERNRQELSNSIKRTNLQITGIKEGEEVQAKGIHNIFNK